MKYVIGTIIALSTFSGVAHARDVYVNGYTRANGTVVQPYERTAPDNTLMNNYSTQGNTNPYTGQQGTVNPYNYNQPKRTHY